MVSHSFFEFTLAQYRVLLQAQNELYKKLI